MKLIMPQMYPVACHTDNVGKGSTFVAIKGLKEDGVKYISEALKKGATKIIVEQDADLAQHIVHAIKDAGAQLEFVPSARAALAYRSARALDYPAKKLRIVGVTGTKGKTTSSFLLEHMLRSAGYKTALLSTVKNKIGDQEFVTNLTTQHPDYLHNFFALCVQAGVQVVVMEIAAQATSLHRVTGLEFDGLIFTNFDQEHLEFYPTMDDYFAAKVAILKQLKVGAPLLLNADDVRVGGLCEQFAHAKTFGVSCEADYQGKILGNSLEKLEMLIDCTLSSLHLSTPSGLADFGGQASLRSMDEHNNVISPTLQVRPSDFPQGGRDDHFSFSQNRHQDATLSVIKNQHTQEDFIAPSLREGALCPELEGLVQHNFTCPSLVGSYNAYNILGVVSLCLELGISSEKIAEGLLSFTAVPGRLERYDLPNGATCFIDYAHNPSSYQAVLGMMRSLTSHLIVVFGCGGARDKTKRPLMGAIASEIADVVVLTSDNPRTENAQDILQDILAGISDEKMHKVVCDLDREQAIKKAYAVSKPGSVIMLLGKGPDEYQQIGTVKYPFSEKQIVQKLSMTDVVR